MAKAAETTPSEKIQDVTDAPRKPTFGESLRETADSIVIAFILAFLFRTFEAEAFVIPTGSMALTLMGEHKDVECAQCGYRHRAGASEENPDSERERDAFAKNPGQWLYQHTVVSSACPNCRYRTRYDALQDEPDLPTFKGDRILVTKFSYELADPERFDVIVFKNPGEAKQNYIKRLIGLPEEQVLIHRGDIYVRAKAGDPYRIARKPLDKLPHVMQCVYDNDYVLPKLIERGWPRRWTSSYGDGSNLAWTNSEDQKTYTLEKPSDTEAWIRYQHLVPGSDTWAILEQRNLSPQEQASLARPQLIADFCEYNSEFTRDLRINGGVSYLGLHWVPDLALECELEFLDRTGDDAEAVLQIIEGGRLLECRINAATGDAVLRINGVDRFAPKAAGAVKGKGPHRLRFSNADDQLSLWVDDELVTFDGPTRFRSLAGIPAREINLAGQAASEMVPLVDEGDSPMLDNGIPTRQDVGSPIGIGAKKTGLAVTHLRVLRDVYYIADELHRSSKPHWNDRGQYDPVHDYVEDVFANFGANANPVSFAGDIRSWGEPQLRAFMSDVDTYPERWQRLGSVDFTLAKDQFFVLGDNSAKSSDGRLWGRPHYYVPRDLLIGKALFVYWPHALPKVPGTDVPFPYFPNFSDMRLIR